MPRRDQAYLEDIETFIDRIEDYTNSFEYKEFKNSPKTIDAVVRNLATIGEAVKNLSQDKKQTSDYDWSQIARFRDFVTHQYFRTDEEIIWDIVNNELEALKTEVKSLKD